ncbi:MAG: endonuclease domain-containing protein [bacterium]
MSIFYNNSHKKLARELRNNMTNAEKLLWSKIRREQLGVRFYRQKAILNYIVDFYCPAKKLVIEIDGDSHYIGDGEVKDKIRDYEIGRLGLRVLRFTNSEVLKKFNAVLKRIWVELGNEL